MFKTLLLLAILGINIVIFVKLQAQGLKSTAEELSADNSAGGDESNELTADQADETPPQSQLKEEIAINNNLTGPNPQINLKDDGKISNLSDNPIIESKLIDTSNKESNINEAYEANDITGASDLVNKQSGLAEPGLNVITNVTVGEGSTDGTTKIGPSNTTTGPGSQADAMELG